MPNALKPEREFCASCGFPIRGSRCDVCGRGREPLPLEEGRRQPLTVEAEALDAAGLEPAFEALRAQDLPRSVGHVLAAEGGSSVRAVELSDGPAWIALIRGATVFIAIRVEMGELNVEAPLVRVPRTQRTAVLRLALELCAQELVAAHIALRDDLLLLRVSTKLSAHNPITLRQLLREVGSLAARYTEIFAVGFDARPAVSEEEQGAVDFDALGSSQRLRFGPGTNRGNMPPPGRAAIAAARRAQEASVTPREAVSVPSRDSTAPPAPRSAPPREAREAREAETAAPPRSAAPPPPPPPPPRDAESSASQRPAPSRPRSSEVPTRPALRSSSAPPPPLASDPPARSGNSAPPIDLVDGRRPDTVTTPMRRVPPPPPVPPLPVPLPSSDSVPPPRPSRPSGPPAPPPMYSPPAMPASDGITAKIRDDRRRNLATIPEPTRREVLLASSSANVQPARPSARPMLELEAPSRRPANLIPAVTGENALLPADRLAAMLRQAQTLASLSLDARPSSLGWLVRATVFRAVYEYRDVLPDAVTHLYRCTGIGRESSEPALLVMERVAAARCQVPAEKPLAIEPFTTAPQAKEHVARYIVEIERISTDPTLRHFLALGALSELLVRAKLPPQTDQRLREIITFAQREGPKPTAFDLMMTSLQRISGG